MKQSEIDALERQRQALELRKAGVSYAVIADRLGYASTGGAHKAVATALKKTLTEPADDLRRLEVERLDALLSALWLQAKDGNQGAVDRCIRIMERRAKLLGLDAPTKTDWTTNGEKIVFEVIRKDAKISDNPPNPPPQADGLSNKSGKA